MQKTIAILIAMLAIASPAIAQEELIDTNFVVLTTQVFGPPGSGHVSPNGVKLIEAANEPISISASAEFGYQFSSWSVKGLGTIADTTATATTVTLTGNAIVTANFVPDNAAALSAQLTVQASSNGSGTVTPAEAITLPIGQTQTITATPAADYQFTNWSATGPAIIDNVFSSSTNVKLNGPAVVTANFAKTEDVVSLTVISNEGGNVLNSGTFFVTKGESWRLSALPLPDHIFTGWHVNGLSVLKNNYSPEAEITLYEDTTITASFTEFTCPFSHKSRRIFIRKTDFSAGNGTYRENTDRVIVRNLPMCLSPNSFNPDTDTLAVIIDGNSFTINKENGLFTRYRHGYRYRSHSKIPRVRLHLDFTKGVWSFWGYKVDLDILDNSDGIDVMLFANNSYFGKNYNLEERTLWNFNSRLNTLRPVTSAGTEMNSFGITRAVGRVRNNRDFKDSLSVNKGTLQLPDGADVDILNTDVTLTVADQAIIIPAGSFEQQPNGQYIYNNKDQKVVVKIDLAKKKWTARMSKFNGWGNLDPLKPVNVYLTIGDYQSGVEITPNIRRFLSYNYNKIYWSNRQQ